MKHLSLALAIFVLIGCGSGTSEMNAVEISVLATNQHPFLVDHDRICVITKSGKEVNRFNLYPDTGGGLSTSNLYELPDEKQYVLIDQNGTWYYIDLSTGNLVKQEWHWQEKTPNLFIGAFAYNPDTRSYRFIEGIDRPEQNIYLLKDPNQ